MRLILCLLPFLSACTSAWAADKLIPAGSDAGCVVVGDDGGSQARLAVPGNTQFMVSASTGVTYRACTTASCTATKTDAPVAGSAQVDLCMPSGYSTVSFGLFDGGISTVCVYGVSPKTVCQINSP